MVDKLNTSNEDLINITADMQKTSAKITQFASRIKNISTVIGVLAEITSKAISAGII
jgi:transketolase C-terminal domain/subunit